MPIVHPFCTRITVSATMQGVPTLMKDQVSTAFESTFGRKPEVITVAPGRVEFIGNHTDYNGGSVIGAAIDLAVYVAIAERPDSTRRFASPGRDTFAPVTLSDCERGKQTGGRAWTNYPLGVLAAMEVFGLAPPQGFEFLVLSTLPTGSGLSSSAALELASALAFLELTGHPHTSELIAKLGGHAENHFVGVPCGILDQSVSAFGQRNHLVLVDARNEQCSTIAVPEDLRLWIFNTHSKHRLIDGLYADRHAECRQAAGALGVKLLADADRGLLDGCKDTLPNPLLDRATHVIHEIERVRGVVSALKAGDLRQMGALLTASHRSSQHYFGNSIPELDFLVDTLETTPGVFGARLTGGGFGGAVLAATGPGFAAGDADRVTAAYHERFHAEAQAFAVEIGRGARVLQTN